MKKFIYSLMTDRQNGAAYAPFKFILYIVSLLYGVGVFTRGLLYKSGIFKAERVPIKIISVGNLTLGGTGKTPFVIKLAQILEDEIKKGTCILIRGYGWDEQAMLKKRLPDIPILVGENRVKSSRRAIKLYGSDAAILDDGFQYWELARSLDIVLIDSRCPFGNGHLFPRGILRETKRAIGRADIVVFTKVDKERWGVEALKEDLKRLNERLAFMEAVHKPKSFYDPRARRDINLSAVAGKRVILLSSIGDPVYFEETVKGLGANVIEHIAFSDHHNYSQADARLIMKRCGERAFDLLVTTEKDAVKLSRMSISFGKYATLILAIEMEITLGKETLIDRLHSLYSGKIIK